MAIIFVKLFFYIFLDLINVYTLKLYQNVFFFVLLYEYKINMYLFIYILLAKYSNFYHTKVW